MIAHFFSMEQAVCQPEPASVGVAFSGGGTRAMVCALGQLRGLHRLGVLDRFSHMASVSGGGWTAIPFAYLPAAISDEEFLGPVVEPGEILWGADGSTDPEALTWLPLRSPARVATEVTIEGAIGLAQKLAGDHSIPDGRLWARVMSQFYLQPYGLGQSAENGGAARFFGFDTNWLREVLAANEGCGLSAQDFDLVSAKGRPFLVVGISLFLRPAEADSPLIPLEATPMATGVLPPFVGKGPQGADVGGGAIAGFAYGATDLSVLKNGAAAVEFPAPDFRFGLADILSASSAAFAEACHRAHALNPNDPNPLDAWIPTYPYAAPLQLTKGHGETTPFPLSDGGDLENSGIVSLLRHGANRVLSFINCETPISRDPVTGQVVVDDQIPPLFGFQPHKAGRPWTRYNQPLLDPAFAVWSHNQVFPSSEFESLLAGLFEAAARGEANLLQDHTVLANDWFGTSAGKARVLWVYNAPAPAWRAALVPDVLREIEAGAGTSKLPYYPSLDVQLNAREVNLLAHQTCWRVMNELHQGEGQGPLYGLTKPNSTIGG